MTENTDIERSGKQWYALQVRSRHEKRVFQDLTASNHTVSLPLINTLRQWSDRKKKVQLPLFRGYLFVEMNYESDRFEVLKAPGAVRIVALNGRPSPIPAKQMYWLDIIMQEERVIPQLEYPKGSTVQVIHGPLRGLEGRVIHEKSQTRLVVWFDAIMQGLAVDIEMAYIKPQSGKIQIGNMK